MHSQCSDCRYEKEWTGFKQTLLVHTHCHNMPYILFNIYTLAIRAKFCRSGNKVLSDKRKWNVSFIKKNGQGWNDNHVEKLLGQNMVDEINYFVHHCHGKEFCTTYLSWRWCTNLSFPIPIQGLSPGPKCWALQYPFSGCRTMAKKMLCVEYLGLI